MAKDPEIRAHQEWLGYLQPVGLVVSPPALLTAQAHINRNIVPEHRRFLEWAEEIPLDGEQDPALAVTDLPGFFADVLGWAPGDLLGTPGGDPLPEALEVTLPNDNETLRPTCAIREFEPKDGASPYLMLIQALPTGADLDAVTGQDDCHWQASPQARFERLLRETGVPIGLLVNGTRLRLVYAPKGENSGHVTFPVRAMSEVGGRPIFAALHLLLSAERLFSLPEKQRLPAILDLSRKYQNQVTEQLAGQVLAALYELLRGFQAADEYRRGGLLREALREDPDHVYAGLLTVLLRLVFTLYAEERGLLSNDPVYVNHYAITGLFERLRADAGRYPDTMDQRYGAWAQLLSLFRLIHDGGGHAGFRLPPRHGHLFNPDLYNFLEGRPWRVGRVMGERIDPPMVPDGVVFRVLENLMVLDGERLSYRTLNVEQIGSVYETMMGFHLEVARGRSIAIKPARPHGAPATINLDELLQVAPDKRAGWVRERTDQTVEGASLDPLKAARTPEDLVAALSRKVAREATPSIAPAGAMVLQPSDERRRSGSHYTPSTLTGPIVRAALRPILERLGERPTPDQVLDLKVCDPAMGSGAFLVEACRQLGDALVKAWHGHACAPPIPPDEDEHLHARRLVAQRCLYGVDKNPMAVDLAKLSLWLETLARDHAFTFLDHALRHGDSLVGLTRDQIGSFHWTPAPQADILHAFIEKRVKEAMDLRGKIQAAGEGFDEHELRMLLLQADEALAIVENKVKPERMRLRRTTDAIRLIEKWWLFGRSRPELQAAIRDLERVLVINCGATPHMSFAFMKSQFVFAHSLSIFALDAFGAFYALQSRVHEVWARFFASSMKDDLRYTSSDCFETFPFPEGFETHPALESAGRAYYEFRADLMVRNNEGLTKTYNRFHDPEEHSPDVLKLRDLHAAMDRAVLDAYGWTDLHPTCEFLLDYEEEEGEEEGGRGRTRKKPWRYRWPDEFRDEVLARLLALNRQRAEEELLSGRVAEEKAAYEIRRRGRKAKGAKGFTETLFKGGGLGLTFLVPGW